MKNHQQQLIYINFICGCDGIKWQVMQPINYY